MQDSWLDCWKVKNKDGTAHSPVQFVIIIIGIRIGVGHSHFCSLANTCSRTTHTTHYRHVHSASAIGVYGNRHRHDSYCQLIANLTLWRLSWLGLAWLGSNIPIPTHGPQPVCTCVNVNLSCLPRKQRCCLKFTKKSYAMSVRVQPPTDD